MEYYLGIDGGGTKTRFCLADGKGKILHSYQTTGVSYRQYSIDTVRARLLEGTKQCLSPEGITVHALSAVCMGYPCYGESEAQDEVLKRHDQLLFAPVPVLVVNDVEIAWTGALDGEPGVHVVCGTGSIAFGGNAAGETARCGGWLDYFSDEGSGYWLGRKAMQLFSQQADGREGKGPLYKILYRQLGLHDDISFIDRMAQDYIPYRDRVASLQLCLLEAARAGDITAQGAYAQAVNELARLVKTLMDRLNLPRGCAVTYSGSLFKAQDWILSPFKTAVAALGGIVIPPRKEPVEGAIRLIMKEKQK